MSNIVLRKPTSQRLHAAYTVSPTARIPHDKFPSCCLQADVNKEGQQPHKKRLRRAALDDSDESGGGSEDAEMAAAPLNDAGAAEGGENDGTEPLAEEGQTNGEDAHARKVDALFDDDEDEEEDV